MSFAKRSGIKELMRFASVICDSAYKGNDMSEKLRKEGRMLWFERKKQCEKSGRIAESKLTFPLMILILVGILKLIRVMAEYAMPEDKRFIHATYNNIKTCNLSLDDMITFIGLKRREIYECGME